MKSELRKQSIDGSIDLQQYIRGNSNPGITRNQKIQNRSMEVETALPEVLFICSFPPRVCGIATYSQDLTRALSEKFGNSFSVQVCALESGLARYTYPPEVKYRLNTSKSSEYSKLARHINENGRIKIVVIQHEFGFFQKQIEAFQKFMYELSKPVVIAFHTVLPYPDDELKEKRHQHDCHRRINCRNDQ